jgi:hypothetical protein
MDMGRLAARLTGAGTRRSSTYYRNKGGSSDEQPIQEISSGAGRLANAGKTDPGSIGRGRGVP